ncbi:MAG: 50S ribosomal protein L27 [Candidatus Kerfeldbacteria bacterium]|nr:50S ribosomal protein L27 [Candidatus Kerfeldbacteria bacterium]
MAHVKGAGTTSLGRDSHGQRLGVKLFAGQKAQAGNIIIRQRGTKFRAGTNVRRGLDDTLYAEKTGVIAFSRRKIRRYNGKLVSAQFVSVKTA